MGADSIRVVHPLFQAEGGGSIPTSALQLHFGEIGVDEALALNKLWHSVLPKISKMSVVTSKYLACFVASYESKLYAVAIWTHPVASNRMAHGSTAIELRRLAIAPDAPKNTASRMLAIMAKLLKRKYPSVTRLLSYQAKDHHEGTIYKAAGWTVATTAKNKKWKPRQRRANGNHFEVGYRLDQQTESEKVRWEKWLVPKDSLPLDDPKTDDPRPIQKDLFPLAVPDAP